MLAAIVCIGADLNAIALVINQDLIRVGVGGTIKFARMNPGFSDKGIVFNVKAFNLGVVRNSVDAFSLTCT